MLRTICLSSALALAGLASAAAAEEHYVVMLGNGYFPDYVHPVPGDTIRFVNEALVPMAATATDDSWTTGVVLPNGQYILTVVDGMKQTFTNKLTAADLAANPAYTEDTTAVGVVDYLNPANTTTNATTGETFDYASQ